MLQVVTISNPAQKRKYLQDYLEQIGHGKRPTWVVSDLRHKFEIQSLILKQQDFFEDLSVIRASELWKFLFKRTHPNWKLVSNEFLKTWIRDQIKKRPEALSALASSQSDQVVYDMMNLMIPLLGHPMGKQRIREWFSQNPESLQRWGGWYLLSEELFDQMVENKRASMHWLSGLMQSDQTEWSRFWQKPLIFDLGSQMSQIEADLIKNMSQSHDVLVIAPEFSSESDFKYLLKPYEFLKAQIPNFKSSSVSEDSKDKKVETLRFSGPLAEAKNACQQVRRWLEQKVPPAQIAVIAPDIEQYWPLLDTIFKAEGIPVGKDRAVRLQGLPAVIEWIASLKVASGDFHYSDLERAAYIEEKPELRFEEFKGLFSEMLTGADLKRHSSIEKSFRTQVSEQAEMNVDQFIGVSLKYWRERTQFAILEICLRELMTDSDVPIVMNLSSWISYLSQIVAKKEISIQRSYIEGVQMTNLSSADSMHLTHRIFMGLTESMVQNHRKAMISSDEIHRISTDIGFDLPHPETSSDEFDLEWLSKNSKTEDIYTFPQTGFSGSAEAPCALWVSLGGAEGLNIPKGLRWDFVQRGMQDHERVQQDQGIKKLDPLRIQKQISLSPSSIESYRKCAFIFASQKMFRLMDFPVLDLDVDRRTRGLLAHAMLEKLTIEPRRYDFSSDEIRRILEDLRQPLGLDCMDDFIWQGIKEKHRMIAERFLDFENSWKRQFPQTQTVAVEKSFEFNFQNSMMIKGKIDRIDQDDQGNLVVIDYKVSPGDHKNFTSWISDNQIQLGLYMLAIESDAIKEFSSREVVGAFYYILKTMNRDRGLKVEEKAGTLFDLDRKKNRISSEKKQQLLSDITKFVAETVQQISSGVIDPVPLDPKDCITCHWRSLCRAPHLN